MVTNKELRKIRRYRRKLNRFWWKLVELEGKAPNEQLKRSLRATSNLCLTLKADLSGDKPLEEQTNKGEP